MRRGLQGLILVVIVLAIPVVASAAPIAAESNTAVTSVMGAFLSSFDAGYALLEPWATTLFYILVGIEIVWAGLYWALQGENFIPQLIAKVFFIGVFYYLVINWSTLAHAVVTGFIQVGAKAGGLAAGTAVPDLRDPSQLLNQYYTLGAPIAAYQAHLGFWSSLKEGLMLEAAYLILSIAVIIIAVQCALTYLEFYLVSVIATVLVPFGVNKHLSFLAERAFGAVISYGVKTAVLAFILTAAAPILASLTPPAAAPTIAQAFNLDAAVCVIAFLAWHAPGMAAGLMGGGPTLHARYVARVGSTAAYLLGRSRSSPVRTAGSLQQVRAAAGVTGGTSPPPGFAMRGVTGIGRVMGAASAGVGAARAAGRGAGGQAAGAAAAAARMATAGLRKAYKDGMADGADKAL